MTSNDDVKLPEQQQEQHEYQQVNSTGNNTYAHFRFPWEAYSPSPRIESSTREGYFDAPTPTHQQQDTLVAPSTNPHVVWSPGFQFPNKRGSDAKDFATEPHDSIQRHGSTEDPKSIQPSHSPKRRRSSISGIPIPPDAVLPAEGRRPLPQRRRSNSLPSASVPSLHSAPGKPEVRKVIFTPSPFRRDTLFPTDAGPKPLATFKGERLVEHPEEEFEPLRRPSTRESVRSLERWHNLKSRAHDKARSRSCQILFEYSVYTFLVCFIYFVAVGRPLWKGLVWYMWYARFLHN